MSGTNDSLIIGCVLVLVFGALFYYLHSRLVYAEKRVNVMETILLDFKNASENFFTPSEGQKDVQDQEAVGSASSSQHLVSEDYSSVAAPTATTVEDVSQQQQQQEQYQQPQQQDQILRNYESMNIKELQQEARNRNISGISGLRRKELIQALRKLDDETSQRLPTVIEELNAPPSSITETAELVDANSTN